MNDSELLAEELPPRLDPGLNPLRQGGLTVGLMPNSKAPSGRRVLHFAGFTEFLLALYLILDVQVRFVTRGDLKKSVADRHNIARLLDVPPIYWRDEEGERHELWVDYVCELRDGGYRLVEGGSLLPGKAGLENIRRANEALASYAEREGFQYRLGTRSCLSKRFTINALYLYLGSLSYRGPRSLVEEVARIGPGEPWVWRHRVDQLAKSVHPDIAHAAVLCTLGEALRAGHLDFPLALQRIGLGSSVRLLRPDSEPIVYAPDLLKTIPEDLADLIGDDDVPDWVERTGEVRPELLPDPRDRRRLEMCLAAAREVENGTYGAEKAAGKYDLKAQIKVSPSRFAEMYREAKGGQGPKAYLRYATRKPAVSQLHEDVRAGVLEFAQVHKGATSADVLRDPDFRDIRDGLRAQFAEDDLVLHRRLLGSPWQIGHFLASPTVADDPKVKALREGRHIRRQVVSAFGTEWLGGQGFAVHEIDERIANFMVKLGFGEAFAVRAHQGLLVDVVLHAILAVVYSVGALQEADHRRLMRRAIQNRRTLLGPDGVELPWDFDAIGLIYRSDHGGAIWNNSIFDLVEDLAIVYEAAAVRQPWRKPHVEQINREWQDDFDRLMPSWVGANPNERGLDDKGKVAIAHDLTLDKVEAMANLQLVTKWMPMVHGDLQERPVDLVRTSDRLFGRRRWTDDDFSLSLTFGDNVGEAKVTSNGIWYLGRRYTDPLERDAADLHVPDELSIPPEVTRGRTIAGVATQLVRRVSNTDDLRYLDISQNGTYLGRVFSRFFMTWDEPSRPVSLWEYREWQKRRRLQRPEEQEAGDQASANVKAKVPMADQRRAARDRAHLRRSADRGRELSVGPTKPSGPPPPRLRPAPKGENVFEPAEVIDLEEWKRDN